MKDIKNFEKDIQDILLKYATFINAGEVVGTLIQIATTLACVKAYQTNELDDLKNFLNKAMNCSIENALDYFKKNNIR